MHNFRTSAGERQAHASQEIMSIAYGELGLDDMLAIAEQCLFPDGIRALDIDPESADRPKVVFGDFGAGNGGAMRKVITLFSFEIPGIPLPI